MRLLLLAQFFPPDIGGEEQHVFNLANTLADRGHEVAVATQRMAGVPDEEVLASGVRRPQVRNHGYELARRVLNRSCASPSNPRSARRA